MRALVIAAVERELNATLAHFASRWEPTRDGPSHTAQRGCFGCGGKEIVAAVTGIGAVNAAACVAAYLSRRSFDAVWMLGSCGSHCPDIRVGDVIVAEEEINGDLGIQGEEGWQGPEHFGFDVLQRNRLNYVNRFPCSAPAIPPVAGYRVFRGPMLTVSTVSGCRAAAVALRARFHALAENMEGAAAAQVAAGYGLPFIEIRGVSNTAGDRDRGHWDMDSACRNCQDLAIRLLESP